jgi:hypothetical protein
MNGAGLIHDYELALIGATTESVAGISQGQFGLWHETGQLNDLISQAAQHDLGIGEYVGSEIERQQLLYRHLSIAAAGARLGIPVTVHVSIGEDIIHEHPNCDGAALGKASYTDFLILTHSVSQLEGGVMLNVGSAVMVPRFTSKPWRWLVMWHINTVNRLPTLLQQSLIWCHYPMICQQKPRKVTPPITTARSKRFSGADSA